jgi:hypothetical protein
VRFLVYLAVAAIVVLAVRSTDVFSRVTGTPDPEKSVAQVNDILERAAADGAVQGQPPDGRWAARMKAECARREQRLAALARPTSLTGLAPHAQKVLAIHRAYAQRVARLRVPGATANDAREVNRLHAEQLRALQRVAQAARAGDFSRATNEGLALRELAGRANTVFLRLGLNQCALRPSAIPV